jgi:outer membrane biosynthesis protein TonB
MAAEHRPVPFKIPEKKAKPVLDENGFQELLAAAYVLQQHNDSVRAKDPAVNTSAVLSEIAEIQSLVRDGGLDIAQAAKLIAERLRKITSASGVSISLVTDGYLDCVAESGVAAAIPGSSVASHSLVATEKLRSGEIFESSNAFEDIRLSVDICRELGVASLIAAPIHEFGDIAGLVEVRWDRPNAFQESDVRACRLMAGLTTSVIERKSRNSEREARTSGAAEPAKPSESPAAKTAPAADAGAQNAPDGVERCRVCGRPFGPHEAFCGNCSLPRMAVDPSTELQSKWASMWYMQQAQGNLQRRPPAREVPRPADENRPRIPATPAESPELRAARPPAPPRVERRPAPVAPRPAQSSALPTPPPTPTPPKRPETTRSVVRSPAAETQPPQTPIGPPAEVRPQLTAVVVPRREVRPPQALVRTSPASPTSVAVVNPAALEAKAQTTTSVRIAKPVHKEPPAFGFNLQTRDAMVAGGAILVAVVMLVLAASTSPNSRLSWFDALLVNLGVTQAPAPNQALFSGNPDARVWVDVHTGLYYCHGSDLYGKTPGGRFTDQIDAQKDQFEPASRSVCK